MHAQPSLVRIDWFAQIFHFLGPPGKKPGFAVSSNTINCQNYSMNVWTWNLLLILSLVNIGCHCCDLNVGIITLHLSSRQWFDFPLKMNCGDHPSKLSGWLVVSVQSLPINSYMFRAGWLLGFHWSERSRENIWPSLAPFVASVEAYVSRVLVWSSSLGWGPSPLPR